MLELSETRPWQHAHRAPLPCRLLGPGASLPDAWGSVFTAFLAGIFIFSEGLASSLKKPVQMDRNSISL